ncbi:uncharacterized protein LOC114169081 isoform X3 [Vigna unguiculata]|uniref:uncharacterized protein LOC114169081 isoform X3 n=1 Tax=Vigna unguiculata TaxID=3917 RepID=UPI001016CE8B|nr:uncharacterized protein LOC114169081 isoform X3 [Vigna unguiculata]
MATSVSLPCFSHTHSHNVKLQLQRRRISTVSSALAETAASMAVAVTFVGAAATLIVKRSKTSESAQSKIQFKACEDCGGSGICSECNGEGFVLRKRSGENSEQARVQPKNMATRFTSGSGAIVQNALLVDRVQPVVAVES